MLHGPEWDYYQGEPITDLAGSKISLDYPRSPPYFFRFSGELCAQDLQHGMRSIDPCDIHTLARQRQGDSPGTASKFKNRPAILIGQTDVEVPVQQIVLDAVCRVVMLCSRTVEIINHGCCHSYCGGRSISGRVAGVRTSKDCRRPKTLWAAQRKPCCQALAAFPLNSVTSFSSCTIAMLFRSFSSAFSNTSPRSLFSTSRIPLHPCTLNP